MHLIHIHYGSRYVVTPSNHWNENLTNQHRSWYHLTTSIKTHGQHLNRPIWNTTIIPPTYKNSVNIPSNTCQPQYKPYNSITYRPHSNLDCYGRNTRWKNDYTIQENQIYSWTFIPNESTKLNNNHAIKLDQVFSSILWGESQQRCYKVPMKGIMTKLL